MWWREKNFHGRLSWNCRATRYMEHFLPKENIFGATVVGVSEDSIAQAGLAWRYPFREDVLERPPWTFAIILLCNDLLGTWKKQSLKLIALQRTHSDNSPGLIAGFCCSVLYHLWRHARWFTVVVQIELRCIVPSGWEAHENSAAHARISRPEVLGKELRKPLLKPWS